MKQSTFAKYATTYLKKLGFSSGEIRSIFLSKKIRGGELKNVVCCQEAIDDGSVDMDFFARELIVSRNKGLQAFNVTKKGL